MDFGLLFVTLLLTVILAEAALKWTKLCKLEYNSNCNWYRSRCDISTLYCNKVIECDDLTTISIKEVNYGIKLYVYFNHCQNVCNGPFGYSHSFTSSLMYLCNGKQVCELSQWNVYNYWKLHVNYDCTERYHLYTRKINTTSVKPRTEATSTLVPTKRPQHPHTTTSSNGASKVTTSKPEDSNAQVTVVLETELKSIELCKFEYRSSCSYWHGCHINSSYCNNVIKCDEQTTINIIKVKYGTNYYVDSYCPHVCNGVLRYSQPYTSSVMYSCNGKHVCDLSQWNTYNYWRLHVNFNCKERTYHRYTRTINTTSVKPRTEATSTLVPTKRPQAQRTTTSNTSASRVTESKTEENNAPDTRPLKFPTEATKTQVPTTSPRPSQTTMSSIDATRVTEYETEDNNASDTRPVKFPTEATKIQVPTTGQRPSQMTMSSSGASRVTEYKTKDNNASDQFPVLAVAGSISAGIIILIIVLIVVVCVKRRRRAIKKSQVDETTLQMQSVSNNSYGCSPPSVNTENQQETDEHAYVDITLQNGTNVADGTSKQEYVYLNADNVLNTAINDEYNTLKTHALPLKMDPNYDHIPKCSHTTVDETYSHVTDGGTTMPDATYSHLKDTKSATSRNAKSNQNKSDNVYNHINTKSVEENVYNTSQTRFNRSSLSHLGETKAEEDDYDHTDWKQTKTGNSKSKSSNNVAVKKNETKNITERARDEYAVVKKRSDNVESSDGHNYFVLEKQFYKRK